MRSGTIVDATIINAPPSTKNSEGKRDGDMHQTKKGNQWFFGMKAHIGADAESGLVCTVTTTPANVADITVTAALLHGEERTMFADAGYTGAEKRDALQGRTLDWQIAARRNTMKKIEPERPLRAVLEHAEVGIRAKVEHPFMSSKTCFVIARRVTRGWQKTRYRCDPVRVGQSRDHKKQIVDTASPKTV